MSLVDKTGVIFEIIVINMLAYGEHKIDGYTYQERLRSKGFQFPTPEFSEFVRSNSACLPNCLASVPGLICIFPESATDLGCVDVLSFREDGWGFSAKPLSFSGFSRYHFAMMIKSAH